MICFFHWLVAIPTIYHDQVTTAVTPVLETSNALLVRREKTVTIVQQGTLGQTV